MSLARLKLIWSLTKLRFAPQLALGLTDQLAPIVAEPAIQSYRLALLLHMPALVFEDGETYNCTQRTSCALWVKCSADLTLAGQDMHWVVAPGTPDITIGYGYPSADVALKGALEVK